MQDGLETKWRICRLTDLASLGVGGEEVHDLDAGDEDLLLHAHLAELGRLSVNRLRQYVPLVT